MTHWNNGELLQASLSKCFTYVEHYHSTWNPKEMERGRSTSDKMKEGKKREKSSEIQLAVECWH